MANNIFFILIELDKYDPMLAKFSLGYALVIFIDCSKVGIKMDLTKWISLLNSLTNNQFLQWMII